MASAIENVKMGPCVITYDGVDLGYTKGGVTVTVETNVYTKKVDQFGETPIGDVITGRTVKVKVPLAETTLTNMVRIMPGATLVQSGGVKATGTVTFSTSAPINNDSVTVGGVTFTFKTTPDPLNDHEMAIPASINAAASALAAAISAVQDVHVAATAALGVVTITADDYGTAGNSITLAKSGTNIAVSGATLASGANWTVARVDVPAAAGTDLISLAKTLTLRPRGNTTDVDDFVVYKAATGGSLEFAYNADSERIFNVEFQGYPDNTRSDAIFALGSQS